MFGLVAIEVMTPSGHLSNINEILICSDLLLTSIENIFDEKHVMQFDKVLT